MIIPKVEGKRTRQNSFARWNESKEKKKFKRKKSGERARTPPEEKSIQRCENEEKDLEWKKTSNCIIIIPSSAVYALALAGNIFSTEKN